MNPEENQLSENQPIYALVLGGSNFMGKETLLQLSKVPNIKIHCINRGKKHWYPYI